MKTMTCKQLGGACDQTFTADTFQEIAQLSQQHGSEMVADPTHAEAMAEMMKLMQDQTALQAWMNERETAFNALPEDAS
jgi:bifunctional pyridoxal-dependent enzyme with beta-cystathionase and maltose regulon repressor activities